MHRLAVSMILAASLLPRLPAQEPEEPSATEKQQIEAALKLTRDAAATYEFVVQGDAKSAVKLVPEPVLRWSNPSVGEIHGNVFLWTRNSRPVAVGSLFKWFSPHKHTSHEFQSLWEEPLTASYEGRKVWTTREGGGKFMPIAGAEAPAETASRRQTQLRNLARRFRGDLTTREGEEFELRLLTQPVYRYEAAKEGLLDGAIFAFVQGTDPEILLLLEARGGGKEEKPAWHFAGGRMHNVKLRLKFEDREVWSVPQLEWSTAFDHTQPYTLFDTPGK